MFKVFEEFLMLFLFFMFIESFQMFFVFVVLEMLFFSAVKVLKFLEVTFVVSETFWITLQNPTKRKP